MLRARAILALATVLSLVLLRPMHWGVHALGGHGACHESQLTLATESDHAGCDHDHGRDEAAAATHSHDGEPTDRDDLADCELCLAIGLLAADLVCAPLHIPHAVPAGRPIPASFASPACQAEHAPLHARPPPASTT